MPFFFPRFLFLISQHSKSTITILCGSHQHYQSPSSENHHKTKLPHLSLYLYLWIFSLSSATMAASTFPLRSSRALQNPLLSPFLSSHSHLNPTPRPLLSFPFRLRPKTGVKLPNGPPRSFKIFSVRESNGTFDPASLLHSCSFLFVDLICFNFAFRFLFWSLIDSAYVYFTNCFYGRFCVAE